MKSHSTGAVTAARTNSRKVRPREIRARNTPTNGPRPARSAQKNNVHPHPAGPVRLVGKRLECTRRKGDEKLTDVRHQCIQQERRLPCYQDVHCASSPRRSKGSTRRSSGCLGQPREVVAAMVIAPQHPSPMRSCNEGPVPRANISEKPTSQQYHTDTHRRGDSKTRCRPALIDHRCHRPRGRVRVCQTEGRARRESTAAACPTDRRNNPWPIPSRPHTAHPAMP